MRFLKKKMHTALKICVTSVQCQCGHLYLHNGQFLLDFYRPDKEYESGSSPFYTFWPDQSLLNKPENI